MKDSCYLILNRNGIKRMNKDKYSTETGEIVVKLNISLPEKLFQNPIFQGNLIVTEEQLKGQTIIKELEFELKRIKDME